VPLRVFIRRLRELSPVSTGLAFLVIFFLAPALLGLLFAVGTYGPLIAATILALVPLTVLSHLALQVRKVIKAGHTVEDIRLALQQDVIQRNEEFRFEVGDRVTTVDRVARKTAIGGVALGAAALAGGALGIGALLPIGTASLVIGLGAAALRSSRARRRADITGERWLRAWAGRGGDMLYRLAGLGLGTPEAIGAGTYRPTEMAISISAARLFEELPKETRRSLAGLPATVHALELDARTLRQQVAELNGVLSEIGDDPAAPGSEARAKVRADVEATRDHAGAKLREVVTALETIRLGLLRMHAGERVLGSVTTQLETAQGLSADMSGLLEGHREVERLLAERRATGVFRIVDDPV
jgi:hypothetical protein